MNRRLEDRIRQLCTQLSAVKTDDELHSTIRELRLALQEHVNRLKNKAVIKLLVKDEGYEERRFG